MELRSKEDLHQQKGRRAQGTLNFRSTKKLLQLQQKGLPCHSKTRRLLKETKQKVQETWQPAHDNEPKTNSFKEKLPKKLLLLEEFYNSMEAAISLLRIRHEICTFSTIAAAVECSTHRRFLRIHLAQIKYIFPEALQVEEYLSWDAESQCSRRDLRVTLLPISKEETASKQRYMSPQKSMDMVVRQKEFRCRLLEFFHKNKEIEVDVPQAAMFGETAAACHGGCNTELYEPSSAHVEHPQKVDEMCTLHGEDCDENLNAGECEHTPLPIRLNLNQLKKYPRSPTKIHCQQQGSLAPIHGSMSHLPPIFKPHFSSERQPGVVDGGRSEVVENAVPLSGSVEVAPQSSVVESNVSQVKRRLGTTEQATLLSVSDAILSPLKTPVNDSQSVTKEPGGNTSRVLHFSSPIRENKEGPVFSPHDDGLRTPKRAKLMCAEDKARSTEQATPLAASDAFLSPNKTPANDLSTVTKKSRGNGSRVLGNVSRVLPFNSPAGYNKEGPVYPLYKDGMHTPKCEKLTCALDMAKPCSTEQATPLADRFRSPIQTPASDWSSVTKKKDGNVSRALGNVSRVLPFNSPIGKKKVPGYLPHEDGIHKSNCIELTELKPHHVIQGQSQEENLENAHLVDESHAADFVDLTSINGVDQLSASDVEILKCLPQELLNDVQSKERKCSEEMHSGIVKKRRRQQLIAGLPKLFNMVRLIFQSGNRTVLTRKDLTKIVLSSHPDITDQGEIIEQLQLLVELAPEWISVKLSSTGDSLYRINKNANMRAVSKALVEAK